MLTQSDVCAYFRRDPVAVYPLSEAAWLAGVSSHRLASWRRSGLVTPSTRLGCDLAMSWQDLAETLLVHFLVAIHRVDLRRVRDTARALGTDYDRWPLARAVCDGRLELGSFQGADQRVLVVNGHLEARGRNLQALLNPKDLGLELQELATTGWPAAVVSPPIKHVVIDPEILGGEPTIKGRRISALNVALMAAGPKARAVLEKEYELKPEQIDDAVRWYKALVEPERLAA